MLRVIAAAVLGPRGLLLVSKRAAPEVFYLPGGKLDPGEAPLDCLRRELREDSASASTTHARSPRSVHGPRSKASRCGCPFS